MRLALVHALGRLATYVALGAVAGAIGSAIDLAGHLGGVQRVATIVAGVAILAWGACARSRSRAAGVAPRPRGGRAFARGARPDPRRGAAARARWLVGVLTGLLPCGWLWAFVVAAGGTGSAGCRRRS